MALQNAPQVLFRNDPPLELQGVPGVKPAGEGEMSYVTFGIAPSRPESRVLISDLYSPFPPSPHSSAPLRKHLSHSDLPRLLPLPYQSIEGRLQGVI